MISNNKKNELNISNLIFSILPVIIAIILQYVAILGDILILFIYNIFSDERSVSSRTAGEIFTQQYNQPMNLAAITLAQFMLFFIVFGLWYYKVFCRHKISDETLSLRSYANLALAPTFNSFTPIFMVIAGVAGQFMVDGVLALLRPVFQDTFKDYDAMVTSVTGAGSSWLLLLAVMVVAPIGEEFLFRGLTQSYAKRCLSVPLAILFQGIIFGVYHGNIIQGVYAFILGSVLGMLAYEFGSITPGILLHISINTSLLFVPHSLFETTTSSAVTAGVAGIIFVVTIVVAVKFHRKHKGL